MPLVTPENLTREAVAALEALRNEAAALESRRFFKDHEQVVLYGIKTQKLRELEKDFFARVKQHWTFQEAVRFCDLMLANEVHECKALGIFVLARFQRSFEASLLAQLLQWLERGLCSNWAAVDTLSMYVGGPLIQQFPEQVPELQHWAASQNIWVRRTAVVSLVTSARAGLHLAPAYALAEALLADREDLIQKAVGWLLRECGKTDPVRLEAFLRKHGPAIPRITLRYAIERFPKAKRQELLEETRG